MSLQLEKTSDRCRTQLRQMTQGGSPRVLFAPYRICPIGAHIDHQGGTVLGQAIDVGTTLAFVPDDRPSLRLRSANYPDEVHVDLRQKEAPDTLWGRYVWAAARACEDHLPRTARGLQGAVEGSLPGGGLSSSASFLIALQSALLSINEVELAPMQRVRIARRAENEFVGLACGILDQASILGARKGHLLSIDANQETWQPIAPGPGISRTKFLVCFSGAERQLATSGFNARVAQCHEAAAELSRLAGSPPATTLGAHADEVFARHGDQLRGDLRKRATHFFTERERVRQGTRAWQAGDLHSFGAAMRASCESSIRNFEVGSPELQTLQDILSTTPGVLGSRFSGAGFAGCVLALVDAATADTCRESVREGYARACPALSRRAKFFIVTSGDGVRFL
jgi:galactokinase